MLIGEEQEAGDEAGKLTRDQRREDAHMKVMPPLAVAPITQDDDNLLDSCGMLRVHA